MNWAIKIISKTLMTKISHISWWGYDKGFYGIKKHYLHLKMNKNTNKGLYKRNELGIIIGLRTEEMNKLAINYQINWM